MRRKTKLPPGLYRRKKKRKDGTVVELPTIHCFWYVPGQKQAERTSTGTEDVDEALRFLHARKAETGHARAQRRRRSTVRVQELLDLVVKDYADEGQELPRGKYGALNYALGHLRAVEDVQTTTLDDLCREWRRHGIRWHKDAAGVVSERTDDHAERADYRVRPIAGTTCNRYMAFLSRGYSLAKEKLGIVHPTLAFPHFTERKNPRPIPPDLLGAIFEAGEARDDEGRWLVPEARVKFLRFLYLVGPRKGQVLATRADQFTPATGTMHWSDEDTKQDQPHIVTYTGKALEILLWFVDHRDPANPALFQEDGEPLTIYKVNDAWTYLCEAAGLPMGRKNGGYTIHNLRHTYVSEAHEAGETAGVIMAMTGHLNEPTMLHYLRVSGKAQQRSQERLEAHRREQAAQVKASNVVRLRSQRAARGA